MRLTSWGKYPIIESTFLSSATSAGFTQYIATNKFLPCIARGAGRSYGDSALAETVLSSRFLNHLVDFDAQTGTLRCEAGVTLAEMLGIFVPRGWFIASTPGTKLITVGGAVASDVHGKSHHIEGCFSQQVLALTLLLGNGEIISVSRESHPDLFRATCGGMGLTGMILDVTFKLRPINSTYLRETTFKAANLEESLTLIEESESTTYSVAWIDCVSTGSLLGRSLLMVGEFTDDGRLDLPKGKPLSVPVDMPGFLLNQYSVAAFNALYYHRVRQPRTERVVHFEPFFYPLDGVHHWNRIYGKDGFTQYQFVLPKESGWVGMAEILKRIAESKRGSFLAVLKAFGKANDNYLSFPMEGYTLALDFKIDAGLFGFLDELDRIVLDHGGRLYLSKDVRMSEATFKRGYPLWETFSEIRHRYGATKVFRSLQSDRLGL
ncbi:MAG: FAD-dependent oxidoreductase [Candidatus Methylumidiphilus sp.]